jgi:ABC-2 type transport system ATP-binding protein
MMPEARPLHSSSEPHAGRSPELVLEVEGLTQRYAGTSRPANDDISFTVERGEIFGILGDNGAGKTTLVHQIVNLVRPSAGSIRLFGREVAADPIAVALQIGFMPQQAMALNHLTLSEALVATARLRGLSWREARAARQEMAELWDLGDLLGRTVRHLSGGQQRLVQLAITMAADPPVLILDEPTTNLDPPRRRKVWEVLRRRNRELGTTVIFITHDALEAEKAIDRVAILDAGRLVALGRPIDLKREVDRKLRLELYFDPAQPPRLPAELVLRSVAPGRSLALIDWGEVPRWIAELDLAELEDFRLHSATLEDLYFHYAGNGS